MVFSSPGVLGALMKSLRLSPVSAIRCQDSPSAESVVFGRGVPVTHAAPATEGSFASISESRARTVVEAWADRTAALSAMPGIQQVFPFHLVRLGGHYIFGIGFEPTVASGLRIRRTLAAELDVDESHIIVQGYTNGYGHYITTPEEYAEQNYEGGSTAYGPWTLAAVQQIAADLARDMTARRPTDPGTPKRDLTGQIPISPLGNPGADLPHPGKAFGDVIDPPQPSYRLGQRASVRFAGTNPNSDLKRGSTYLTVEREQNGRWVRIHDDGDWSTMILFEHIVAVTKAYITWDIPHQTPPGRYRFTYSASGRHLDGSTFPVEGTSPAFDVR